MCTAWPAVCRTTLGLIDCHDGWCDKRLNCHCSSSEEEWTHDNLQSYNTHKYASQRDVCWRKRRCLPSRAVSPAFSAVLSPPSRLESCVDLGGGRAQTVEPVVRLVDDVDGVNEGRQVLPPRALAHREFKGLAPAVVL